jgi:Uma2 family endonuclease
MELSLDLSRRYTYADYLTWQDDRRRELVNGFVQMMTTPRTRHQEISGHLHFELCLIIRKNKGNCEVYAAPFDVRLPKNGEREDGKIDTVVQPDICIICDLSKLDERGCLGAPDMVAEIQSASTNRYDVTRKFELYEAAGVREYWIVYPSDAVVVFLLQPDGKYDGGTRYDSGAVPVSVLGGAEISLTDLF